MINIFKKVKTELMDTAEKKQRILILEDEGDICFLLNVMLKNDNVEIEHVNTLAQADVFLKEQTPDVLIMDNKLPDGRGVNHIEEIKRDYPEVKIVMISGNSDASDKAKAIKNGADRFLSKPFTKEQMQKTLAEFSV